MMERGCKKCDGMGMVIVGRADGGHLAEECECRLERRIESLRRRMAIPERYKQCTLENFKPGYPDADRSLVQALIKAQGFVNNYPHDMKGVGLLFTGDIGTGKTHLAVGILQALRVHKSVPGLFCDSRGLLKRISNSYNPRVDITELEVLRPVFEAEVLVIDELGSAKKTEWVADMMEHILNTRYNEHRTTIITTNYPDLRPGGNKSKVTVKKPAAVPALDERHRNDFNREDRDAFDVRDRQKAVAEQMAWPGESTNTSSRFDRPGSAAVRFPAADEKLEFVPQAQADAENVMAGQTLGDRIGERMRSRLSEMCVPVEMHGRDYRLHQKRASF